MRLYQAEMVSLNMGKVFKISKKTKPQQVDAWLASLPASKSATSGAKKFNAKEFAGKLNKKWDGLSIQKEMRNEW